MPKHNLHEAAQPSLSLGCAATKLECWVSRTMLRTIGVCFGLVLMNASFAADYDQSMGHLMVVLREVEGANKQDGTLKAVGPARATLPSGEQVEITPAWFDFIGDMQIRFVYDSPTSMRGLTAQEFAALKMSPEEALTVAIRNIKRVYGSPVVSPWLRGVMLVSGESPDLDSSYFLDADFWQQQLKLHPDGLVVGVPKRGGLVFVPLADEKEVSGLRKSIGPLYASSEHMRVSSALYLFKGGHWSVFQAPIGAK